LLGPPRRGPPLRGRPVDEAVRLRLRRRGHAPEPGRALGAAPRRPDVLGPAWPVHVDAGLPPRRARLAVVARPGHAARRPDDRRLPALLARPQLHARLVGGGRPPAAPGAPPPAPRPPP